MAAILHLTATLCWAMFMIGTWLTPPEKLFKKFKLYVISFVIVATFLMATTLADQSPKPKPHAVRPSNSIPFLYMPVSLIGYDNTYS